MLKAVPRPLRLLMCDSQDEMKAKDGLALLHQQYVRSM